VIGSHHTHIDRESFHTGVTQSYDTMLVRFFMPM